MAWIMHENEKKIEIVGPQLVLLRLALVFDDDFRVIEKLKQQLQNVVSDYIVQALSMVHSLHKKLPFGCSQGHELKNKMQYLDPIYLLWTTGNHKCWNTYEQSSQTRCCFLKRFKNPLFKSSSWPTRHAWVHLKRNKTYYNDYTFWNIFI